MLVSSCCKVPNREVLYGPPPALTSGLQGNPTMQICRRNSYQGIWYLRSDGQNTLHQLGWFMKYGLVILQQHHGSSMQPLWLSRPRKAWPNLSGTAKRDAWLMGVCCFDFCFLEGTCSLMFVVSTMVHTGPAFFYTFKVSMIGVWQLPQITAEICQKNLWTGSKQDWWVANLLGFR